MMDREYTDVVDYGKLDPVERGDRQVIIEPVGVTYRS